MKQFNTYPFFILLCLFYFLLPTFNAQIDSWFYAACVKHHQYLNQPHHLLFNYFGLGFYNFIGIFYSNVEAIHALFIMNAVAASICLLFFNQLLKNLGASKDLALSLTLFCGSCFGFFRFATDAETYILPLCFSVISTYFYTKSDKIKHGILASLFSVLAVTTHQIHLWWSLAMFLHLVVFRKSSKKFKITYTFFQFLIPFIYLIAYVSQTEYLGFFNYLSGEYSKGNAGLDWSFMAILLTCINVIRSFIQVHGNSILLINKFPFLFTIIFSVLLYIIFILIKKKQSHLAFTRKIDKSNYSILFFIAIIFHLIFAFLSSGNAEFMVMLPFLLVAFLIARYNFQSFGPLIPISIILLIWNLSFGIIPNRFLNLNSTKIQETISTNNSEMIFMWKEKPLIENRLCYKYGFKPFNFITNEDSAIKLLNSGASIIVDKQIGMDPLSRKKILKTSNESWQKPFNSEIIDSIKNFYGKIYIIRISKP
ncbi:MAG: hypothetical protein IT245_00650 [Bacteroidia bacterium]|nr:hypothetical protein [Bacteroidia bacterium]